MDRVKRESTTKKGVEQIQLDRKKKDQSVANDELQQTSHAKPSSETRGGANKTSLGSVGNLTGIDDRIRDALLENELEKLVNEQKYEMECDLADEKMSICSDPIKIDMDVDNNSNVF